MGNPIISPEGLSRSIWKRGLIPFLAKPKALPVINSWLRQNDCSSGAASSSNDVVKPPDASTEWVVFAISQRRVSISGLNPLTVTLCSGNKPARPIASV